MARQIKVSLNKIAEFAYAGSHRRKVIVQQQKNVRKTGGNFAAMGYREAENWLPGYIDSNFDPSHLALRLNSLEKMYLSLKGSNTNPDSGHLKALNNGVNALTWLSDLASFSPPTNLIFQSCDRFSQDGLIIGNVFIKARPDGLVIRGKGKSMRVGALKFHFSKSCCLNEEMGDLAAVGTYIYLNQCSTLPAKPLHSLCYSIDAYKGSTRTAPANHIKKYKDLVAACEEYELIWNSIP